MNVQITLSLMELATIKFDDYLGGACNKLSVQLAMPGSNRKDCADRVSTWLRIIEIESSKFMVSADLTVFEVNRLIRERNKLIDQFTLNAAYQLRTQLDYNQPIQFKYSLIHEDIVLAKIEVTEVI